MSVAKIIAFAVIVLGFVFLFSAYQLYVSDSHWALPFAAVGAWMIWSGSRALKRAIGP